MPLLRARKNATEENRQKVINQNMAILFGANKKAPGARRKSAEEIKAAALSAAENLKLKTR